MAGKEEGNIRELTYSEEETPNEEEEGAFQKPSGKLKMLAEVLSFLFHPLFVPSVLFGVVLGFSPYVATNIATEYRLYIWGLLTLTTLVIPLSCFLVLHYFGTMPSLSMTNRNERPAPFMYISVFYGVTTYFFISRFPGLVNINVMLAGITIILFALTLITFYRKISAHSTGVGGAVGFLASFTLLYNDIQLLYPLSAMVVLAGLIMSARLYLNEHTPLEVWTGALLGFTTGFASVFTGLLLL